MSMSGVRTCDDTSTPGVQSKRQSLYQSSLAVANIDNFDSASQLLSFHLCLVKTLRVTALLPHHNFASDDPGDGCRPEH